MHNLQGARAIKQNCFVDYTKAYFRRRGKLEDPFAFGISFANYGYSKGEVVAIEFFLQGHSNLLMVFQCRSKTRIPAVERGTPRFDAERW